MTTRSCTRAYSILIILFGVPLFSKQFVEASANRVASNDSALDSCSSNPCLGGTCFANRTDYHCYCPSGFTGKNCETVLDACSSNPCVRGSCLHHQSQYICVCPTGYTGLNCESITNACNSNPCLRGECYHSQDQFHCVCPSGYTGKTCEIENNDCISEPCLNGGSCVDDVHNFSCKCLPGFGGRICELDVDECSTNPCMNGGVCVDGINRFTCQCKLGYSGDKCQTLDDPCKYNPCIRGTCFSHLSQFLCECPAGYKGKLCDETVNLRLDGPREVYLKLPVGSPLSLNCSVTSSSSYYTVYQWSKVQACDWSFQRRVYHLDATTIGDTGTYSCKVTYRKETPVQKFFHVEITSRPELCNFDDRDLCGWQLDSPWHLQDGQQSYGSSTEVYNDRTLGTENGRYLEARISAQRDSDQIAVLTSQKLPATYTICFEFWYRLSGNGLGKLTVLLQDSCLKKQTKILEFVGDHGRKWNKASTTILKHSVPNDYEILIQADIRRSFHGVMAVDDLLISNGTCQGDQGISLVG